MLVISSRVEKKFFIIFIGLYHFCRNLFFDGMQEFRQ